MIPCMRTFNNLQNRHIYRFPKSVGGGGGGCPALAELNTVALSPTDFTVKTAQYHLNQYFKAYCHIT